MQASALTLLCEMRADAALAPEVVRELPDHLQLIARGDMDATPITRIGARDSGLYYAQESVQHLFEPLQIKGDRAELILAKTPATPVVADGERAGTFKAHWGFALVPFATPMPSPAPLPPVSVGAVEVAGGAPPDDLLALDEADEVAVPAARTPPPPADHRILLRVDLRIAGGHGTLACHLSNMWRAEPGDGLPLASSLTLAEPTTQTLSFVVEPIPPSSSRYRGAAQPVRNARLSLVFTPTAANASCAITATVTQLSFRPAVH
jgi:hypothetical protein